MKGFKNAKVYITGEGIKTLTVGFEDNIIKYIGNDSSVITEEIKLSSDQIIVPSFIDLHIHGAGGADAMDGSVETLSTIATELPKEGTAMFLATTMTMDDDAIMKSMNSIKEYMSKDRNGAIIIGAHLEGPFIAEKYKGAQRADCIVKPSIELFKKYNKTCGNAVKKITLAPEIEGANELINYLAKNGIVASAGHSDATYKIINEAVDNGLKSVTHLFNAQSPLHHREVGVVGSGLLIDDLYVELICDLLHVSAPAIKLVFKNKPYDKTLLITDSMRAKNLADGISELGGQEVFIKNGEARLANGTIAGSTLKMNIAVKNLIEKVQIPFERVIDSATINPATSIGIQNKCGSITVNKMANFTVLNSDYSVYMTIINGKVQYKA